MNDPRLSYHGYRFPPEIISYCVWLYFRFSVSYRDIEELMAERGVTVTYETIRAWCYKFGRHYAKRIRASRGPLGDTWHLDEVYLKIDGCLRYLWRAVDQDGSVLDILVQRHRDKKAAGRFFKTLLRGLRYAPRVVVTDRLTSYIAPCATLLPNAVHRLHHGIVVTVLGEISAVSDIWPICPRRSFYRNRSAQVPSLVAHSLDCNRRMNRVGPGRYRRRTNA
jgi:putative transposase